MEETLRENVKSRVQEYISSLDGAPVKNLYALFVSQVEAGLIEAVLEHTEDNRSHAAAMLGMSRTTLIKKLKELNIVTTAAEYY